VEAQAAEDASALAAKQAELDGMLVALGVAKQRGRRLLAVLEKAVYRLHQRNQLRKRFTLVARAWHAWRSSRRTTGRGGPWGSGAASCGS
jgi:hypothetical protein